MMDDGGPLEFDEEFFMTWLLPPIIFGAAFILNVDAFQASLFPTLLFASWAFCARPLSSGRCCTPPARLAAALPSSHPLLRGASSVSVVGGVVLPAKPTCLAHLRVARLGN